MSVRLAYIIDMGVLIWVLRQRPQPVAMLQALAKDGPLGCSVLTEVLAVCMKRQWKCPVQWKPAATAAVLSGESGSTGCPGW